MNEDGKLWFGVGLDTAQLKKDSEEAKGIFKDIGTSATKSGEAGDQSYKQMSVNMKQAIKEQKQLISEIKADIKNLQNTARNPLNKDAVGDLFGAKKALKEEEATLIGMQRQSIVANTAETASQGGIIASLGKWFIGLASVGAAMKIFKSVIDSTEGTADKFSFSVSAANNGLSYFWKTLATGDWSNFMTNMLAAIEVGYKYAEAMDAVKESTRALSIEEEKSKGRVYKLTEDLRNRELSSKQRVQKGEDLKKEYQTMADLRTDIATDEYKAAMRIAKQRSKLSEQELVRALSDIGTVEKEKAKAYNKELANKEGLESLYEQTTDNNAKIRIEKRIAQSKKLLDAAPIGVQLYAKAFRGYDDMSEKMLDNTVRVINEVEKAKNSAMQGMMRPLTMIHSINAQMAAEDQAAADKKKAIIKAQSDYTSEAGKRRIANAFDIEQKILDLEQDGADKSRKQAELNFRKTLSDIEQQKQELIKKQNELSGGINTKTGKPTATFNPILPAQDQSQLDQKTDIALQVYNATIKKGLDALLKEYATFEQKRAKIIKDGDDNIAQLAAANTNGQYTGNIEEVKVQTSEALSKLDKEIAARSKEYKLYVENIAKYALDRLNAELSATQHYLLSGETSEEQNAILRQEIEALQEQISKLTNGKVKSKKDDTLKMLNEINEATRNIISSFDDLDEGTKSILTAATNIAGGTIAMITGIKKIAETAKDAMSAVDTASAVLAVIGAAYQIVTTINSLITAAAEAKKAAAEAAVLAQREEYLGLISYNEELRKEYEWVQKIGEAKLDYIAREGAELKKQAAANETAQNGLFAKLQKETYWGTTAQRHNTLGIEWESKTKTTEAWLPLAGKTFEEISQLASEGKLSEEGQAFYEALKKAKDEGKDLTRMQEEYLESVRETFTGSTRQGIVDSIIEGFKAGKRSAADFASTFADLMKGAVIQALALFVDARVGDWFNKFYEASKSGGVLTPEEQAALKLEYDTIIADSAKKYEDLKKITGIDISSGESSSSSSRSSGFASMSQDTGSELNGRFTALQISGVNIENHLLTLNGVASGMAGNIGISTIKVSEMRDIMLESFSQLSDINKNTKQLYEMNDRLGKIEKNTQGLL